MSDNKTTVVLLRHNAPHVICCAYYFLIFFGYVKTGMNVEWFSPSHEKLWRYDRHPLQAPERTGSFQVIEAPRGRPLGGGAVHCKAQGRLEGQACSSQIIGDIRFVEIVGFYRAIYSITYPIRWRMRGLLQISHRYHDVVCIWFYCYDVKKKDASQRDMTNYDWSQKFLYARGFTPILLLIVIFFKKAIKINSDKNR